MSAISRRKLFAGFAVAPFAGVLLAAADEATPPAPTHKFAPRLSGREVIRKRYFPNVELVAHDGRKLKFYDDIL